MPTTLSEAAVASLSQLHGSDVVGFELKTVNARRIAAITITMVKERVAVTVAL